MKNLVLFFFGTLIVLSSCGEDLPGENPGGGDGESFELISPCIDVVSETSLPAPLEDPAQYVLYEQTLLIATIVDLGENLRKSLPMTFFPPANTTIATVDGITVTATDKAVEWEFEGERWVYLLEDDGYAIYYYPDGNVTGRLVVDVEQNEDCTSFRYTQYELEAGPTGQRETTAFFVYDKAGTADKYTFGTGLEADGSELYDVRVFEDMSGDLTIRLDGQAIQNINWNTDGSGTYEILENGVVVDTGTWSF